jgi:hypothetical protein
LIRAAVRDTVAGPTRWEGVVFRKYQPRWPSHTAVIAYLALFVTLGGSSYAVGTGGSSDARRARAASESSVIGRFINHPVKVTGSPTTVLSLPQLPAGDYVILAKLVLVYDSAGIRCRVRAGGDVDLADVQSTSGGGGFAINASTMTVLHHSDVQFNARLVCRSVGFVDRFVRNLKLTAIQVNQLSTQPG